MRITECLLSRMKIVLARDIVREPCEAYRYGTVRLGLRGACEWTISLSIKAAHLADRNAPQGVAPLDIYASALVQPGPWP
jgi:hypothetical protein